MTGGGGGRRDGEKMGRSRVAEKEVNGKDHSGLPPIAGPVGTSSPRAAGPLSEALAAETVSEGGDWAKQEEAMPTGNAQRNVRSSRLLFALSPTSRPLLRGLPPQSDAIRFPTSE
jgi:hypothetical protein